MPTAKIQIAAERIAEARRLYERTLTPVPDIAAMMGVSRRTLERRVVEWGFMLRSAPRHATDRALAAMAPSAVAANAEPDPAVVSNLSAIRAANAARIQQLVANSLDAVDRALEKVGPAEEAGAERSARTLAAVARTLQEMAAISKPDEVTETDDAADEPDPIPRDIDDIREELARRIHALVDAESGVEGARDSADPARTRPAGS